MYTIPLKLTCTISMSSESEYSTLLQTFLAASRTRLSPEKTDTSTLGVFENLFLEFVINSVGVTETSEKKLATTKPLYEFLITNPEATELIRKDPTKLQSLLLRLHTFFPAEVTQFFFLLDTYKFNNVVSETTPRLFQTPEYSPNNYLFRVLENRDLETAEAFLQYCLKNHPEFKTIHVSSDDLHNVLRIPFTEEISNFFQNYAIDMHAIARIKFLTHRVLLQKQIDTENEYAWARNYLASLPEITKDSEISIRLIKESLSTIISMDSYDAIRHFDAHTGVYCTKAVAREFFTNTEDIFQKMIYNNAVKCMKYFVCERPYLTGEIIESKMVHRVLSRLAGSTSLDTANPENNTILSRAHALALKNYSLILKLENLREITADPKDWVQLQNETKRTKKPKSSMKV